MKKEMRPITKQERRIDIFARSLWLGLAIILAVQAQDSDPQPAHWLWRLATAAFVIFMCYEIFYAATRKEKLAPTLEAIEKQKSIEETNSRKLAEQSAKDDLAWAKAWPLRYFVATPALVGLAWWLAADDARYEEWKVVIWALLIFGAAVSFDLVLVLGSISGIGYLLFWLLGPIPAAIIIAGAMIAGAILLKRR